MEDLSKEISKEAKEYVSVSTRLPNIDAIRLNLMCKRHNTTPSNYIRDLIKKNLGSTSKKFLAGKNELKYNKLQNNFSWLVNLDSGEKIEILNNLSDDFLKNLKKEIDLAIQERNNWIHQRDPNSVQIPNEILEDENER